MRAPPTTTPTAPPTSMPTPALLLAVLLLGAAPMLRAEPEAAPGAGRDLFVARCAVCHSIDYIEMHTRFSSRALWESTLNKMRNAFKAPLTDAEAKEILDYLERQYTPQRTIASNSMSNTSVAPGLITGGEPRSP